ncbi:hypothetical protein IC614_05910 [Allosphingosinicella flava]|uniref:Uncharacterized protein n=1 Tax=Allosphingosinicella flava TaxID=2771430 RepID=A0A7T2GLK4_9SPHN|nr:hypothetical protein [Sphingosinicella flava]QPQ56101.1 hypothetical protein IC614_05910 [Sphingosinicella flava]
MSMEAAAILLLGLASLNPQAPRDRETPVSYVILADEGLQARLSSLLAKSGIAIASSQSGMIYAGCASAWRSHREQADLCIASRMTGDEPDVVLNGYVGEAPPGRRRISCVGRHGADAVFLPDDEKEGIGALRDCLSKAAGGKASPSHQIYGVRSAALDKAANSEEARAAAASVLILAVDHVGIPRGLEGDCLVEGRIKSVARGAGFAPYGRIELSIPCGAESSPGGKRRVAMANIRAGTFAAAYFDDQQHLLDFHSVRE